MNHHPFKHAVLPDLPYEYGALDPFISEEIMYLHHRKHHSTYVNNFNVCVDELNSVASGGDIIRGDAPPAPPSAAAPGTAPKSAPNTNPGATKGAIEGVLSSLSQKLRFNVGGVLNHSFFWPSLAPPAAGGGKVPAKGPFYDQVLKQYGSVQSLVEFMSQAALSLQGSGWVWLVFRKKSGELSVLSMPNQDHPTMEGWFPLLGIDVWEHAYYLQYKNARNEYIDRFWNIVLWSKVEQEYTI